VLSFCPALILSMIEYPVFAQSERAFEYSLY
jgi:hypothetical protein